ncbi:MAG: Coq4 family protein [Cyanobacteriota bacterium]|jgi:ubiquinone biosynthesis protein COQ4
MAFRYLDQIATKEHIQEFLALVDLAGGAGQSASNAFLLSHRLRTSAPMRLCERILGSDPAATALIKERRLVGPYDSTLLRGMPKGSLGHTYVTVLDTMGYDINFFPEPAFFNNLETDADYINYRVFATHDIHHILSGFSLDNYGEVGVISISVGQFNHPGLAFIDLMSLLLNWFRSDTPESQLSTHAERLRTASYTFRMIHHGLEIASVAKLLFTVNWEDHLERNLDELRAELGIEPVKDGPWSWYSQPAIAAALDLG